jgi:low temperature requirement protein LtrA
MELFFDLVYVFAVTQLSHTLLEHTSPRGALETAVLFLAVWWAWNYTAWATNWIDPDVVPVRAMLVVLMVLSLVMSAAIPRAFGDEAMMFALAYVAIQVLRSAFAVVALRGDAMSRNYAQLLAWSCISGVVWLVGAGLEGDARLGVWIAALLLDVGAPTHGFWLPRLGGTPIGDWSLAGGHLAERCQLVVIIALGESILVTGALFADLDRTAATVTAFVVAFLGSVALWWVYFAHHAEEGAHRIETSGEAARMGRAAYAYGHALMVAGVIVAAVADERVLHHPGGEVAAATGWTLLAGPAIYLAGNALFNGVLGGRLPAARLVAIAALALLGALAPVVTPLALAVLALAVLVGLIVSDGLARRARSAGDAVVAGAP